MLKVPAAKPGASAAQSAPAKPAAKPKPAPAPVAPINDEIGDLFAEEGLDQVVEAVCPVCRSPMPADAVLCVQCGYHKESGSQFEGHKTAGVDIDHGTLALEKAQVDMVRDRQLQEKMLKGAGLPWWGLALVLFLIGSGVTIAVLYVNAANRVDQTVDYDSLGTFYVLAGSACGVVALGAYFSLVIHGFKNVGNMGLLNLIPPYAIYYVFVNFRETWKSLAVLIVLGTAAGILFAQASARGVI